jgi:hypothetical protein
MTMATTDDVGGLIDRQEIQDVLYRYCRGIDRHDEALLRSVYHADAIDDHGFFSGTRDAYIDWVLGVSRDRVRASTHAITNCLIELHGDAADVESQVHSYIVRPGDGDLVLEYLCGRFVDRFERRDGGSWKIAHRVLVRDWDHQTPLREAYADPGQFPGGLPVQGLRTRDDVSYRVPV